MAITTAYVGVGSNLGKSEDIVAHAINDLRSVEQIVEVKSSAYYLTDPVGNVDQDQFINAVIKLKTTFSASELLEVLHGLEKKYKRVRTIKWGPRTLDLDIELFGDQTINTKDLVVPHPEMFNRLFVLTPLLEVLDDDNIFKDKVITAERSLAGSQYIKKLI
ncbi:2-amino-4-hydroxy-6-hydroxymethyldihydropteridine diphosphokinase [Companilactobacillus zhongbaensis]|uniref:2-amino-4-hydroxy-6- hydroxymethyldihydropteridine diphosphokinase n=1 Tax=Companilactobacillus zhongbaensis TaxID=2486009 RepID=UPI001CDD8F3F|nr:2-amino-4-hydroxy-6-hydroxymethyldihydropteridine diphosphokinase [Companilactobacillus zhongbaensis]